MRVVVRTGRKRSCSRYSPTSCSVIGAGSGVSGGSWAICRPSSWAGMMGCSSDMIRHQAQALKRSSVVSHWRHMHVVICYFFLFRVTCCLDRMVVVLPVSAEFLHFLILDASTVIQIFRFNRHQDLTNIYRKGQLDEHHLFHFLCFSVLSTQKFAHLCLNVAPNSCDFSLTFTLMVRWAY